MDGERYFYHSFPRPKGGKSEDAKKALAILSSILDRGLLLTPEQIEFKEVRADGSESEPWRIFQKRICFTELSPSELSGHTQKFGPFSLEWEIKSLRALGAMPVFYLPLFPTQGSLDGIGSALLSRLGEVQGVLTRIKAIKSESKDGSQMAKLVENLTSGIQDIDHLLYAVKNLAGFFYPIHNLTYTDDLGYYRQREWRIVGNMIAFGRSVTKVLASSEIKALIELDRDFFAREIEFPTGRYTRAEQCQMYGEFQGQPLYKTIRRILVPHDSVEKVYGLLRSKSINLLVVDSETI